MRTELAYPVSPLRNSLVEVRPWRLDDQACIEEAATDPAIPRGTTVPAVYSLDEGEAFIRRQWSRLDGNTGVSQAIAASGSGRAVGLIFLSLRPQPNVAGLGYWIVPSARRKGFASAAVGLVTDWALHTLNFQRVEAWVMPANSVSERTLLAAGFEREGRLRNFLEWENRPADAVVFSRVPEGPAMSRPASDASRT